MKILGWTELMFLNNKMTEHNWLTNYTCNYDIAEWLAQCNGYKKGLSLKSLFPNVGQTSLRFGTKNCNNEQKRMF